MTLPQHIYISRNKFKFQKTNYQEHTFTNTKTNLQPEKECTNSEVEPEVNGSSQWTMKMNKKNKRGRERER